MNRRHLLIGAGGLAAIGAGAAYLGARRMGSPSAYRDSVAAMRAPLGARPDARDLVRYATLAPNGHNTQPWRFELAPGRIVIRPDFTRRTPVVDPDDHHIFVSLGCAAENLALAAAARGLLGEPVFDAAGGGSIAFAYRDGPAAPSALFDAIAQRQSTRADYDGRAVGAAELKALAAAATVPGVETILVTGRREIDRIRDLVLAGNSAQMADPAFVQELKTWLRFSPRHALATGDGLYGAASGNPPLPEWLGARAFDLVFTAGAENDKYAGQLRSSSGVAVFVAARDDPAHWVLAGRACQRFALQATALGLKHAFLNQPVEVPGLRADLAALAGTPGRRPNIVMRFGYGPTLPYSARRPVEAVIGA